MKTPTLFFASFFFATAVFAQDASTQLRNFLNHTNTWQAEFEQVQPMAPNPNQRLKIRRLDTKEGEVFMAKPNKLRWETKGKTGRLVVSDGETLWHYDRALKEAVRQKLSATREATPSAIFEGAKTMDEKFILENETRADGLAGVKLTPKDENSPFFEIHLGLDDGIPKALEFSDSYGFEARISFYKSRVNKKIDPELFEYTIPPGVELIDLDRKSVV